MAHEKYIQLHSLKASSWLSLAQPDSIHIPLLLEELMLINKVLKSIIAVSIYKLLRID